MTFGKARMLSEQGRCKTYDAAASGYLRGEGFGVTALDPHAYSDFCMLIGAPINQDGRSASLTAPHGPSQEAIIMDALSEANATKLAVVPIECHGTGTSLGDPIEVGALRKSFQSLHAAPSFTCMVATAKAHVGHLEGSVGTSSLLKCV